MIERLSDGQRHDSMRGWFAWDLHNRMVDDPSIRVVVGDLGYGMMDNIKKNFPDRFINVGASEQAGVDIAVGMAYGGLRPFFYSITPFALYRPFESVRNYIHEQRVPVVLVGGGRDRDYVHDGFSHWAEEDRRILSVLPNIVGYWPNEKEDIPRVLNGVLAERVPCYINLKR